MRKKLQVLTVLLLAAGAAGAQTFTAANADGVEINYQVVSAAAREVAVGAGSYAGRVVVPDTVDYDGGRWAVVSVGTAFSNTQVSVVGLPATVRSVDRYAFVGCSGLDTLRFGSAEPMGIPVQGSGPKVYQVFEYIEKYSQGLVIEVPCGSLAAYRRTQWGNYPGLRSACAMRVDVCPSDERLAYVDSIALGDCYVHNSSGWYEVGDTAGLMISTTAVGVFFYGWSCGTDVLVVTGADTVVAEVGEVQWSTLDANNISTTVSVVGSLSNKEESANYYVQPGSTASTIFAAALWMGAQGGHVSAHKFFNSGTGSDYLPGPLRLADGGTSAEVARRYNRVWRVSRRMIDEHIASVGQPGYEADDDIATWPAHGPEGYAANLAPFYDADGDGRYDPYAGDYPRIRGDVATYSIFNDGNSLQRVAQGGSPLGVEVHAMMYAFDDPQDTALANTVFVSYTLFNRSSTDHDSTYLGAWADYDIGNGQDDYIGSHIGTSMFYGYNSGTAGDADFQGGVTPAQGCIILESPAEGNPMSSFMAYENSDNSRNGEPNLAGDYYNYLRACWKNGQHLMYGGNGLLGSSESLAWCDYIYARDSEHGQWEEWMMESASMPGDRRGVGAAGPFTFEAGGRCQFTLAYLTAWDAEPGGYCPSYLRLIEQAPNVHRQYQRDTTDSGRPFAYEPYSPAGVDEVEDAVLGVSPNPTTGSVKVRLAQAVGTVEVYDMTGRIVASRRADGKEVSLDLSHLRAGVYLVRAGGQVGRVVVGR